MAMLKTYILLTTSLLEGASHGVCSLRELQQWEITLTFDVESVDETAFWPQDAILSSTHWRNNLEPLAVGLMYICHFVKID